MAQSIAPVAQHSPSPAVFIIPEPLHTPAQSSTEAPPQTLLQSLVILPQHPYEFKLQTGIIVEFVPEIESSTALDSSFLPAKIIFEMINVE